MVKKCVFEHCENEGSTREITFVTDETRTKYHANVLMCQTCYSDIWRNKRNGTQMKCDVLYQPSHTHIDFDATRNMAIVKALVSRQRGVHQNNGKLA